MEQRPDLGYFAEGYDLASLEFYAGALSPGGEARVLPPPAYRSLAFAQLEDEAIWTRDWICIGSAAEIPESGDLLPFTVGTHGLHVQRTAEGLVARFNKAQHGGCRVVPVQCQGGTKTRCSFTSCGYSRDRAAIPAGELGDGTPEMHQYLGLRPERLWRAHVGQFGPLIFVNLDAKPQPLEERLADLESLIGFSDRQLVPRHVNQWLEFAANWKILAQHMSSGEIIENGDGQNWLIAATCLGSDIDAEAVLVFPNLVILSALNEVCFAIIQPTAIGQTLCRFSVFTDINAAETQVDWAQEIRRRGAAAETAHDAAVKWGTSLRPETVGQKLPLQADPLGLWLQKTLAARAQALPQPVNDIPLYQNPKYQRSR
jgi:hypothetical protein